MEKDTIFHLYATRHASIFLFFFAVSNTLETRKHPALECSVKSRSPFENFVLHFKCVDAHI